MTKQRRLRRPPDGNIFSTAKEKICREEKREGLLAESPPNFYYITYLLIQVVFCRFLLEALYVFIPVSLNVFVLLGLGELLSNEVGT